MGENLFSPRYAEVQPQYRRPSPQHIDRHATKGSSKTDGEEEEEDYTIKCICGFDDDKFDGNTVLCDRCNTWQHIDCYYHPLSNLDDNFEHLCVDCKPSQHSGIDRIAASHRQKALRVSQDNLEERKQKRAASKSHKKTKIKELNHTALQSNGYNHDAADARGASPRENGPPTKKPKTSHKHSASVGNNGRTTNGRDRSGSQFLTRPADAPRPPLHECPPNYFSPDFIRVHHENTTFHPAQANLHLDIGTTDLLSRWLDDEAAFSEATGGLKHNEVFKQSQQPIEDLEAPIEKHVIEDKTVQFHGDTPIWPYLTVDKDLVAGEFVGELRGCLGERERYCKDPANQWNKLRHPDHFVFFHPLLPIYIDSRVEGTQLRYARRSCKPNLQMETIFTGAREYRFCFTAKDNIQKGAEITVPWDTKYDQKLRAALVKGSEAMTSSDFDYVSDWVGTVLAHFGGCACEQQPGNGNCLLGNFDRRLPFWLSDTPAQSNRPRKKKKALKLSPPSHSHGTNSRASSDGPAHGNHDGDTGMDGDRSPSRSTDNKSSRDATPTNNGGVNELSERDKRKLMQQERLFEQMEQDNNQGQKKKKRTSGSNVNTPTVATYKQLLRPSLGASNFESPLTANKSRTGINGSSYFTSAGVQTSTAQSSNANSPRHEYSRISLLARAPPVYMDSSTQTEPEESQIPRPAPPKRQIYLPRTKQLLKRSLIQRHAQCRMALMKPDPAEKENVIMPAASPEGPSPPASSIAVHETEAHAVEDVDMKDPESAFTTDPEQQAAQESIEVPSAQVETTETPLQQAHPPIKPPPPPWESDAHSEVTSEDAEQKRVKVAPMHVDLPPPPTFTKPKLSTETSVATQNIVQSPSGAVPSPTMLHLASPPALESSIARPSPVKKMSLSDYMNKRKTETPALEKSQSQGQPGGGSSASPQATETKKESSPLASIAETSS